MEEMRPKVKNQVIDLLQQIVDHPGDMRVFDRIAEELTTLSIRGTMPAGSQPTKKKKSDWYDDFSERKEACIAP